MASSPIMAERLFSLVSESSPIRYETVVSKAAAKSMILGCVISFMFNSILFIVERDLYPVSYTHLTLPTNSRV